MTLTEAAASALAEIALRHVCREFPNKLDHVLAGLDDAMMPRKLHPIFYGSFDWHSCVHGYWTLARVLRRYLSCPVAPSLRSLFATHLTSALVVEECAYFARPFARNFERPYGWAWLLKLVAELRTFPSERWGEAIAPLAAVIAARFRTFLPLATYPIRAGTHSNTAFALALVSDYAVATSDVELTALVYETALRSYVADVDC